MTVTNSSGWKIITWKLKDKLGFHSKPKRTICDGCLGAQSQYSWCSVGITGMIQA